MLVFDCFPKEPPEIVAGHYYDPNVEAERRFLHLNVSEGGQFCLKANQEEEYYEYTTLKDIMEELEHSIYFPNITSSYNNELYLAYGHQGDNGHYHKLLNAQARLLPPAEESESSGEDVLDT
jgi:ubiquitin-protein ligase